MCGTEVPVFLCSAGAEHMCGWRQTYVRLEAHIENQPILYQQMPYAEPANGVSCTNQCRSRSISASQAPPSNYDLSGYVLPPSQIFARYTLPSSQDLAVSTQLIVLPTCNLFRHQFDVAEILTLFVRKSPDLRIFYLIVKKSTKKTYSFTKCLCT